MPPKARKGKAKAKGKGRHAKPAARRFGVRPRSDAKQDKLAELFLPFAKTPGWVTYDCEAARTADCKRIVRGPNGVEGHKLFIQHLFEALDGNIAFKKTETKKALDIVYNKKKWSMTEDDKADWKQTLARRIRNMLYTVRVALTQKRKWVLDMLDSGQNDAGLDDGGGDAEEEEEQEQEHDDNGE